MAFQVPKSKASIKQNRFEFEVEGTTYDVPLLKYLKAWQVEVLKKVQAGEADGLDLVYAIFGEDGSPVREAVRRLDQEQIDALTDAYLAESKVTPGESEASSDS